MISQRVLQLQLLEVAVAAERTARRSAQLCLSAQLRFPNLPTLCLTLLGLCCEA